MVEEQPFLAMMRTPESVAEAKIECRSIAGKAAADSLVLDGETRDRLAFSKSELSARQAEERVAIEELL